MNSVQNPGISENAGLFSRKRDRSENEKIYIHQERTQRAGKIIKGSIPILIILILWQVLPSLGLIDRSVLPPFTEVLKNWGKQFQNQQYYENIGISTLRVLEGFGLSLIIGIPLGLLIGYYKTWSDVLSPLIQICRQTPALALYPVFILFFGLGETSKVAIVFWVSVWPILLNTENGVRNIDPLLTKAARSMGADNKRILRTVILPGIVPFLMTGIRLGAGSAIIALVAAEMIGAKSGLGYMVINAQYNFQIPAMYVAILSIAIIGIVINELLVRLEKKMSFWSENK